MMVFADCGALFALFVKSDLQHRRAKSWFDSTESQLLTTDFVVDELMTSTRARGNPDEAIEAGDDLFSEKLAALE